MRYKTSINNFVNLKVVFFLISCLSLFTLIIFYRLDYGGPPTMMTTTSADYWPDSGCGDDDDQRPSNRTTAINDGLLSVSSRSSTSSMTAGVSVPSSTSKTGVIEGVLHAVASMLAGVGLGTSLGKTFSTPSRYCARLERETVDIYCC